MLGTATADVPLEVASVRLSVRSVGDTFAAAVADVRDRAAAVRAALVHAGVPTDAITVAPTPRRPFPPGVPSSGSPSNGAEARTVDAHLSIDIEDLPLSDLRAVVEAAEAAGAKLENVSAAPRDLAEARARLRAAAVEEARRRAAILAEAAGARLGPVVEIDTTTEGLASGPGRRWITRTEIQDEDLDLTTLRTEARSTVLVRFALE